MNIQTVISRPQIVLFSANLEAQIERIRSRGDAFLKGISAFYIELGIARYTFLATKVPLLSAKKADKM